MSDENIFDGAGNPTPNQPAGEQPAAPVLPDSVKDLVGPGKKYATVDKALEALVPSQEHIARLEADNKLLREKSEGALSVEQVHETVQELLRKERETRSPVSVDEATISGLLDRKLEEKTKLATQKENVASVTSALKAKFGDKAQEAYESKAKDLGLSVADLNNLSKTSPKAALELFGVTPKAGSVSHSRGTINTDSFSNVQRVDKPAKSAMGGGSTGDLMASWNYAKSQVNSGD